ncbi:uncharacterized protein LOC123321547 [Coccinella septempunctata]|uniref:uncharacterized protein LOC123321547 n=1 Tax=Coccinella septempunctata TaxID=41139 RepID=UPI001D088EBE|nr:uncharacterized protein LOC123321547 [Coccinella septempunctata]
MSSRSKLIMKMAIGTDMGRRDENGNWGMQHCPERSNPGIEKNDSDDITYREKVLHYLESVEKNKCRIDADEIVEPQENTDYGINISRHEDSSKPECSIPYLELSDESPVFDKGSSELTLVKKKLFEEHPHTPLKKINIIQDITINPVELKNFDVESRTSKSFSSIDGNSFEVNYRLPPTSDSDEDEHAASAIRMVKSGDALNHKKPEFTESQASSETKIKKEQISIKYASTKKNKHDVLCPICFEEVGHFSRHLERKHYDDNCVQKILGMPLGSQERRSATSALRKKGNFLLKNEKGKLRSLRYNDRDLNEKDYYPCVNCLGLYKKTYLWRHRKICKANANNDYNKSNKHVTNAQTFMVTTGILGNFLNRSRIKTEVFSIMRADNISFTAKSDPLICLYGESYLNKHKRKQMNIVASNRMREMARLKISLMESSAITSLIDVLKPFHYELIVAAAKVVSGYDPDRKTYKASSLALHFGTNLKFLCDVAKKAILTKNPLFQYEEQEREDRLKQISLIKDIISNHWCNDVSSLANKVLNEFKINKPKILPVTEDVKALNEYIKKKAEGAYENLEKNLNSALDYKVLVECVLVQVLIFNRKRVGEVQFLEIKSYRAEPCTVNQNELINALTDFEKAMSTAFKRVVVFGKGCRPVPLLFTKRMQKLIDMILRVRGETDIVPKSNPYMFANPGCSDRWLSGPSVIRKYAHMCGAKNPETLTSTRFRKQIATILQIMNFEADEMEQIAKFMGHTEKTHKEFYRMSEDVYQTAKVAKVLLLLNDGKGKEFKGKSLAEIDIADDLLELEQEEEDKEEQNKIEDKKMESKNEMRDGIVSEMNDTNTTDIVETYTKSDQPMDDEDTDSCSKPKKGKKENPNKKLQRHTWSLEEKQLVLTYFRKHIRSKRAPRKNECLEFISDNSNFFENGDWVRIKTLVYNTYRPK